MDKVVCFDTDLQVLIPKGDKKTFARARGSLAGYAHGECLFCDTLVKLILSPNLEYKNLTAKIQDAA
jgi:hypothetical protein